MTSQHLITAQVEFLADKAPKIQFVKPSSLGDVLHNLPMMSDLYERLPNT